MAEQGSSTKQLKPTLGFFDLMSSAVGQIIGAGIMSLLPSALKMTGRTVPFAFLIAAVITIFQTIPFVFLSSVVRVRGGTYTQVAMLGGPKFAGMFVITNIMGNVSLAMYGLSLASYVGSLFGWPQSIEKWVGLAVLTIFYILNLLGLDIFAKVQNLLVIILIFSLIIFGVFGIGKVNWDTYFVQDENWMTGGIMGLLQAGGLLTFATGGATSVLNFSAEAKNPTRDIPLVMIVSTLAVAVMYGFLAFVAAGVLPYEEVAGQNLTVVANFVLNRPLYILFVVGGAGCALASTLNNQLATAPKPMMQMCDDGWLPAKVASLNKRNSPYIIQTILFVVGAVCCVSGLSISVLSNMCILASAISNVVVFWNTRKIPDMFPDQWAKSPYHISRGLLTVICAISTCASLFNSYLNASSLSTTLLILNVAILAGALGFGFVREKHAHMDISYETVD